MSVQAMAWAWEQVTESSGQRLVLLALADTANDDGECWPSVARITEKTMIKDRQVRYHLDRIEELGLLTRRRRLRGGHFLGTYTYRLPVRHSTAGLDRHSTTGGDRHSTAAQDRHSTAARNHQYESSVGTARGKRTPPVRKPTPNKYAQRCLHCDAVVPVGEGTVAVADDRTYHAVHLSPEDCDAARRSTPGYYTTGLTSEERMKL